MQKTKWALGFVMAVFGLLITTQIRVTQQRPPADTTRLRADQLAAELKTATDKLKAAERERDRLAAEVDRLRKAGGEPLQSEELKQLQMLSGTVEVQGPGLVVSLVESPEAGSKARVADEDIWLVVHELLAAGAEGVAVNGQRLSALSGIRNVGQRLIIYQTMTSSPFEIAAIGDAGVMEASLRLRGGVVDQLSRWGIKVTVTRSDTIRLPAFRPTGPLRFIRTIKP